MTTGRSDRETTRLIAWSHELRRVHSRLREALRVTREAVHAGESAPSPARDLLLYCHGFCTALDAHHRGEDRSLFPAIEAAHPHLAPVLRSLERDHSMIDYLLNELAVAVGQGMPGMRLDCVESNARLHRFYMDQGYRQVGRRDFDGPWFSAALFEKPLTPAVGSSAHR